MSSSSSKNKLNKFETEWFSYFKQQIYDIINLKVDVDDDDIRHYRMVVDKMEKSLLLSNHMTLETFDEIIEKLEITNSEIDLLLDLDYDNVLYNSNLRFNPHFIIKYFNKFRILINRLCCDIPCIEEVIKIGAPFDVRQNIKHVALNNNVSFEFLESYIENGWLLPNQIGLRHPGLNWNFVLKHYEYFNNLDLGRVYLFSTLDFITPEIVENHPDFKWNLYGLINNKNMTFEFIRRKFDGQFNEFHLKDLIRQSYVKLSDILDNTDLKWDFEHIFKNPNLTEEYIEANIEAINTPEKILCLLYNYKLTFHNFIKVYQNLYGQYKNDFMQKIHLTPFLYFKKYHTKDFTLEYLSKKLGIYNSWNMIFEKIEMSEEECMKYINYSSTDDDFVDYSYVIERNFNLFWNNQNIPLTTIDKLLDRYRDVDIFYHQNLFYEFRKDLTFEFVKKQVQHLYKSCKTIDHHLFTISRYISYDFSFEKEKFIERKAREHMAAFKIQYRFRECLLSPYHIIGIRKIDRDYNYMVKKMI